MNVLITGGRGLIGSALTGSLLADGHQVWVLTRRPAMNTGQAGLHLQRWDGRASAGWGSLLERMDVVVNLAGESLSQWPWSAVQKKRFHDSRVQAGQALVEGISAAARKPRLLVQASGINHYGVVGGIADESTPPGNDYLADLTLAWEGATEPVESSGVRRVVVRLAVALAGKGGLLPLMALPVRLFAGGPLAGGKQAVPWVHLEDVVGALRYLMADEIARGPYNLVAPTPTSKKEFYRSLAQALRRPYWLPTPAFLLRLALGEMATLVVDGRFSQPRRLLEAGYSFRYPDLDTALRNLLT